MAAARLGRRPHHHFRRACALHHRARARRPKDGEMTATNAPADLPQKVSVRRLNFFYGDNQALKEISLPLYANQVTSFIGPSGCGKSTLLRVLNRMYDL